MRVSASTDRPRPKGLGNNEEEQCEEQNEPISTECSFTESLPFQVSMAFLWRFLVAVSKICVQVCHILSFAYFLPLMHQI